MNPWLIFVLVAIVGHYLLDSLIALLNLKALTLELPREVAHDYDQETYRRSQHYTRTVTRFNLLKNSIVNTAILLFLLGGGFNQVDRLARSFFLGPTLTGIIFVACILLLSFLLGLPFSIYATFSIETRFGFNRTKPLTFFTDIVKTILLAAVIGVPLLAFILWFFANVGPYAWLFCWLSVLVIGLLLQFVAPVVIMPLFNTFTPLADGPLKKNIEDYARSQHFAISGIFTMDGSKRSTKLNAFFTGFGKYRKIVFFDTLVDKLADPEIVAVLAHEMGHYKQHHLWAMMVASALQTCLIFLLLNLTIKSPGLSAAFAMEQISLYTGLVFFFILYSPIDTLLAIFVNKMSRTHEFAADRFAATSTANPEAMITALKKLARENFSNLTPHPLAVAINYSHPPVLQRIEALKTIRMP